MRKIIIIIKCIQFEDQHRDTHLIDLAENVENNLQLIVNDSNRKSVI